MPIEIERKFLVKNDLWRTEVESSATLKQGYLARGRSSVVRVRIADQRATLTIKGDRHGISCAEFEYEIPLADAEEMLVRLCHEHVIDKVRHQVRHGGHVWDLDVFHGANAPLVIAEIELTSEHEPFVMPPWAGPEVSHDRRYANAWLVENPYSRWHPETL